MPPAHMDRLARAARAARAGDPDAAPVETVLIRGGQHSWAYEHPAYRAAVAGFLATALGGPLDPADAAAIARATPAERIADPEPRFAAVEANAGGFRTLARVVLPGATQPMEPVIESAGETGSAGTAADRAWRMPDDRRHRRQGRGRHDRRRRRCLARDLDPAGDPSLHGPAARPGAHRSDPQRRPARHQLEEPAALVVHRLSRPGAPARSRRHRAVRRPPRRGGRRDRARDPRSAADRGAAQRDVRSRARRPTR